MSAEERKKILQMVADGKISAEEAATLMRALDEDSAEAEVEVLGVPSGMGGERSEAPEFDEVRRRAMRFSGAFLWIGILFTVFSAWSMFAIQQNSGMNFWFYCLGMPLFLGILLIVLGAGSRTSRWIYVNVDRTRSRDQDGPRKITIALPLPLGLVGWFLRTFGSRISGLRNTNVDEVVQAISMAKNMTEPLIVNVDDADDGEKVQVFIG
ncbi:MAG: hypothetical protein QY328_05150 [Anaerolineales bacterium]|nr:MAG: hypothetical protein QY328_05150 [Anaerolineales bacterium]